MLSQPIESILRTTAPSTLTDIILVFLAITFVLALIFRKANKCHGFTQYTPTFLTTLGILGTFAGIIAGLLGFDVDHIDQSIGYLLEGLKTAFLTSLVGMTLSILYKLVDATGWISPDTPSGIDEEEVGAFELLLELKKQSDHVVSLKEAIGGDSDTSLVGQLRQLRLDLTDQHKAILSTLTDDSGDSLKGQVTLLRSDIASQHRNTLAVIEPIPYALTAINEAAQTQQKNFSEFQDRLWVNLQNFADMLSKSATEQVINALKEVISDFNNNLIEQFGENFKQLNAAVLELVQWQENYKQQLAEMSVQYQQGVSAITQTEQAVSHISVESKAIPENMAALKVVMEVNQHQIEVLKQHLDAFREIRDRAVEAVPEIRAQIDLAVEGMKHATVSITEGMADTSQTLTSSLKTASESVLVGITGAANTLSEGILQSTTSLQESVANSATSMTDSVGQSSKILTDGLKTAGESMVMDVTGAANEMRIGILDSSESLEKAVINSATELVINSEKANKELINSADLIAENNQKTRTMFNESQAEIAAIFRSLVFELTTDNQKLHETFSQTSQALITETDRVRLKFEQHLDAMRNEMMIAFKEQAEQQMLEHQRVLKGVSQHADEALKDTAEAVQKQVRMLDEALNH
ncbi:Multidrug transporter EmrE [Oceanospirillum multiglobuliferum]|uniref:MotA/TolQ/ExbB proton channel domain-containing protein n=1 Tax=Oceanospirillum multiglobuliferum TaxID=64969 RepID=A0A1T4LJB9_9GAMM|nr:hypothetical protein [Oceanospirillum multiglobuliferum]OPX56637.1 hypothetical protein BTE48_01680 [Oceanospirillum multiglobuliferum]SJZ54795.1 Multidrug transporter EmrE [Oceanospirillum multiglobuliferum]